MVTFTKVHFITGKGGTGKTTVAAAFALGLAVSGKKTLLVEVEGRQGLARVFGSNPLGYGPALLMSSSGQDVYGLSIEPEAALLDYLEKFYNLGRATGALKRIGAVDFATTIAPGLRDVLLTGKISEIARSKEYDAIVVDAPPTGRIGRFLNVTAQVSEIAKSGPIHAHAELVKNVIQGKDTAVHLVSTLEEMPVQESLDAYNELTDIGLNFGHVIVSKSQARHIHPDDVEVLLEQDVDEHIVAQTLKSLGFDQGSSHLELAEALIEEASDHARRAAAQRDQFQRLKELKLPMIELPLIPNGIDSAAIADLAQILTEEMVL